MEGLNPLLLYPVLKQIVGFLSWEDLLRARMVCSSWKSEADWILKERTTLHVKSTKHLKKFIKEIKSPEELCFNSDFILEHVNLDDFHNFFHTFGNNISTLKLLKCEWKSATLRSIVFKKLPNLRSLEVSKDKNSSHRQEPLLPMSFLPYGSFSPLEKLRELNISGDYSSRTDLFYDLLKSSSSLEIIRLSKYNSEQDDLFGTWLTEIILSCGLPKLICLELEMFSYTVSN